MSSVCPKSSGSEGLAEQVTAQERGRPARPGDHIEDLAEDLVFQVGQCLGDCGGLLGVSSRAGLAAMARRNT